MSTALAIAGVTTVLRDLLNDGMINHNVSAVLGSTVTVSALPPDRVVQPGGAEQTQLNVFMYLATPNTAWRNRELPSRDPTGTQRLTNAPLALDLHYMITAYGAEDLHADILFGYATQLMHENPVLTRAAIRMALMPSPPLGSDLPPALRALGTSGLADQLEQIRITPYVMTTEEMSRLWSAMQTHYRPTAAYLATVVLIEATAPTVMPLPVLTREIVVVPDLVPPLPTIEQVDGFQNEGELRLDDVVTLRGVHLDGTTRDVLLENERFGVAAVIAAMPGAESDQVRFTIPAARSADFPAGIYRLSVELLPTGAILRRRTNHVPVVVRPDIAGLPITVARDGAGSASFSLTVGPHVRPGQVVSLFLGALEVAPDAFVASTDTLAFVVPTAPVGNHLARLRVDGINSEIIDRTKTPPVFLNERIKVT